MTKFKITQFPFYQSVFILPSKIKLHTIYKNQYLTFYLLQLHSKKTFDMRNCHFRINKIFNKQDNRQRAKCLSIILHKTVYILQFYYLVIIFFFNFINFLLFKQWLWPYFDFYMISQSRCMQIAMARLLQRNWSFSSLSSNSLTRLNALHHLFMS